MARAKKTNAKKRKKFRLKVLVDVSRSVEVHIKRAIGALWCEEYAARFQHVLDNGRTFLKIDRKRSESIGDGYLRCKNLCFAANQVYLDSLGGETDLRYCEGWVSQEFQGHMITPPIAHAWFVDSMGRVVDPVLFSQCLKQRNEKLSRLGEPAMAEGLCQLEIGNYYGVEIDDQEALQRNADEYRRGALPKPVLMDGVLNRIDEWMNGEHSDLVFCSIVPRNPDEHRNAEVRSYLTPADAEPDLPPEFQGHSRNPVLVIRAPKAPDTDRE